MCITGTNTLSSLLSNEGTSIPAFQSFFNYVLLNIIYTSYTLYKYGFKKWTRLILKDGWRYFILSFMDVEGNYFIVLAYRYVSRPSTPFAIRAVLLTKKPDYHSICPANQLLGHRRRSNNLLLFPPRPLPLYANLRHPPLHRRSRRNLRLRPHHRCK